MYIEKKKDKKKVPKVLQPYPVLNATYTEYNCLFSSLSRVSPMFVTFYPLPIRFTLKICSAPYFPLRERHKFSANNHRQRKYESIGARQDEPAETLLSLCISVPFWDLSAPCCPCVPYCRPGEEGAECPYGLGGGGG